MTAKNRAGLITKLQNSLKKHYKPAPAAPGRPLMEHVLYAALLEDAPVDLADEGFAKCEQEFFDWNEVRVTSVTELAEVLSHFPSPSTTALRLKRCLQSVFESFYSFEIEHLKKENLGKAVAKFEAMSGVTPFVLSYLIQHGLGGHAIPVNYSGMWIMFKTGIVTESEAKTGKVPGLERAIPKSKAIEFSSTLHQAAVTLAADPTAKIVWDIIWSVNKEAEMSSPKTQSKRKSVKRTEVAAPAAPAKPEPKATGKSKAAKSNASLDESVSKPAKAASGKASSKAKATSEPAAVSIPDAEPSPAKGGGKSKAPAKSKPSAGVSETAEDPTGTKESLSAKPTAAAKTSPAAKSTTPAKPAKPVPSGKAAAASAKPASEKASSPEPTVKPTKKAAASKTAIDQPELASPPADDTTAAPSLSKQAEPKKSESKKSESKKPESKKADSKNPETAEAESGQSASKKSKDETLAAVGNQKLTKRKPR